MDRSPSEPTKQRVDEELHKFHELCASTELYEERPEFHEIVDRINNLMGQRPDGSPA